MGTRKGDLRRRIEDLEAFARSRKVEDARKRHLESFAKMSDEEVVSLEFAMEQIEQEEDPWMSDELFRSGLAATEYLDERGRLGWRAYCETGGQAAMVDYCDATEGEDSPPGTPVLQRDFDIIFDNVNPGGRRTKGVNFHRARLAREPETKAPSDNDTPRP